MDGGGNVEALSVLFAQFRCELKTVLKNNEVYYKKEMTRRVKPRATEDYVQPLKPNSVDLVGSQNFSESVIIPSFHILPFGMGKSVTLVPGLSHHCILFSSFICPQME